MNRPLPCPWCGHEAETTVLNFASKLARYAVTCTNDECPVEAQATAGTIPEAIALWNQRAPVAMQVAA